jgi:hypothetical protein
MGGHSLWQCLQGPALKCILEHEMPGPTVNNLKVLVIFIFSFGNVRKNSTLEQA